MTKLERSVLSKLLSADHIIAILGRSHPVADALRAQCRDIRVVDRRLTGVGCFTSIETSDATAAADVRPGPLCFGDVAAHFPVNHSEAGFLLWIKDGRIHELEAFSYGEAWQGDDEAFELTYLDPKICSTIASIVDRDGM